MHRKPLMRGATVSGGAMPSARLLSFNNKKDFSTKSVANPVARSPSPTMAQSTSKDAFHESIRSDGPTFPLNADKKSSSTTDQYIEALKHRVQMLQTQNEVLSSQKPDWTPAHTEKLVRSLHAEEKMVSDLEAQLSVEKQLVLQKTQEMDALKKSTSAERSAMVESRKQLEQKLEENLNLLEASQKQYNDYAALKTFYGTLQIEHGSLTKENAEALQRLEGLQETLQLQENRSFDIERDLTLQLAEKDQFLEQTRSELEATTESLEAVRIDLLRLQTWKKSLAMTVPESVISKQLSAVRKEHECGLVAMQMKQADLRAARDRVVRLEQECSSLNGDLRRSAAELQGKTEHTLALQERLRQLEGDAQIKRQLQEEVEVLRADAAIATKENGRLHTENIDLLGRLDVHLKEIPAEFRDAFIDPIVHEKDEYKRASERQLQTVKRLEKESVDSKVELADLQGLYNATYENEKGLQRKVVELSFQLTRLEPIEADLGAAKVQAQTSSDNEALTKQRLEMANMDLARVQQELKSEKEQKQNLEKVLKEVRTLETLGDSVQKLQSSLKTVGASGNA
eukprot:GEMP01028353.1.p1 GENE.GEMP01028353.1~~GEMP01028353.1.p1  ORF type:complete len:578 (+),score=158.37 GEMP01028353.1:27-1736(+)